MADSATDSGKSQRRDVLSAKYPNSGWMSDEVVLATSTMAPVAVKDSASDDLRNGKIAASEPWLMSITMCPRASKPSSRMSGFDRSAVAETGAGSATAAARESEVMALCYTNP